MHIWFNPTRLMAPIIFLSNAQSQKLSAYQSSALLYKGLIIFALRSLPFVRSSSVDAKTVQLN